MTLTIRPFRHKLVVRLDPLTPTTTTAGLELAAGHHHLRWGTVQAIGDDVHLIRPGDRVLVNSLLGQTIGDDDTLVIPDGAALAVAAS